MGLYLALGEGGRSRGFVVQTSESPFVPVSKPIFGIEVLVYSILDLQDLHTSALLKSRCDLQKYLENLIPF